MISIFLNSLIIGYSGAIMPGPMFTYTVDKSMRSGAKSGLIVSVGHAILELILVVLLFAGVGRYLATDAARTVIGLFGGLILGYLGFGMLKDVYLDKISLDIQEGYSDEDGNMFLTGAILSASNPYFIIWWSAVGLTLIMEAYNAFGIIGIIAFYIGHILSDISWFTFVSVLVSKTKHLINIKAYKFIIVILAFFLIGFGLRFLIASIGYILNI